MRGIITTVIERYTLPEMGEIWSDQRRLEAWKQVEVAALAAFERIGKVPEGTAEATAAASTLPVPATLGDADLDSTNSTSDSTSDEFSDEALDALFAELEIGRASCRERVLRLV